MLHGFGQQKFCWISGRTSSMHKIIISLWLRVHSHKRQSSAADWLSLMWTSLDGFDLFWSIPYPDCLAAPICNHVFHSHKWFVDVNNYLKGNLPRRRTRSKSCVCFVSPEAPLASLDLEGETHSVWPDWTIYSTYGNFSKPLATINLAKSPTFLSNYCKGVKIYHFSIEIIFGELL